MSVQTLEAEPQSMLVVRVHGRLTRDDYRDFLPEIERLIRDHGRIRLLFLMDALQGWDPEALSNEVTFDPRHRSAIERLAVVGDKRWERWMDEFSRSLPGARVGYFDLSQEKEARRWLVCD